MPQVPGLSTGMPQAEQQQQQQVSDSGVQARLYTGRLVRGQLMGTRVLLKVCQSQFNMECLTGIRVSQEYLERGIHSPHLYEQHVMLVLGGP